jgi:outer membrane protein TolC
VNYEPDPVDPLQLLAALEARRWDVAPAGDAGAPPGAGPRELSAFAVTHNPALAALRRQLGVAQALLVEAGLLGDPELGWDGMDALASQIVEGTTSRIDFLAGLGISIPLPRPGELDAREGLATWRVEEVRQGVTQAEWTLAREVHIACEDILEAQRLLEQNEDSAQLADSTREYFERAKRAGAATAIQANLAAGDLLTIRAQRVRLQAGLREARQRLDALLGLPPGSRVPIRAAAGPQDSALDADAPSAEALVEGSLSLRPDLALRLANYRAAEEEVRLEVARQFPQVALGTGLWIVPGFFTRFNRPAIDTAVARRAVLRAELEAEVHELRREIHAAHAALEEARRELHFLEAELLPNAEESLRLAGQAFDAGEVTLLEILTLQRALVDARTRTTEARAELRRRHWRLLSASGRLLSAPDAQPLPNDDQGTSVR